MLQGQPYCVAGSGDLLALFRCVSCRYTFGTDISKPENLGAPGRVLVTSVPELACNVQDYPEELYFRKQVAQQCRVQSTMILPIIESKGDEILGVIECVQTTNDMNFEAVSDMLRDVMELCGFKTCSREQVQELLPSVALTNGNFPGNTGIMMNAVLASSDEFCETDSSQSHAVEGGSDNNVDIASGTDIRRQRSKTKWKYSKGNSFKRSLRLILKQKRIQRWSAESLKKASTAIDQVWEQNHVDNPQNDAEKYLDSRWLILSRIIPVNSWKSDASKDNTPVQPVGPLPDGAIAMSIKNDSGHSKNEKKTSPRRKTPQRKGKSINSNSNVSNFKAVDEIMPPAETTPTAGDDVHALDLGNSDDGDAMLGMMDPSMLGALMSSDFSQYIESWNEDLNN